MDDQNNLNNQNPLNPMDQTQSDQNIQTENQEPLNPVIETPPVSDKQPQIDNPIQKETPQDMPSFTQVDSATPPPPPIPTVEEFSDEDEKENQGSGAPNLDIPPVIVPNEKPKKKFGGKTIATILGILVLLGGIGTGIFLIKQSQDIREKAYDYTWPPNGTACTSTGGFAATIGGCVYYFCPGGCGNDNKCDEKDSGVTITFKSSCNEAFMENFCSQMDTVDTNNSYCIASGYLESKTNCGSNCISPTPTPPTPHTPTPPTPHTPTPTPHTPTPTPHTPTPTPHTPTPTPFEAAQCFLVKVYDENWNLLVPGTETGAEMPNLIAGDKIIFTVEGTTSIPSIDKARFTINGNLSGEITNKKPGTKEFYVEYTIPEGLSKLTVKAELHHTTLGWF